MLTQPEASRRVLLRGGRNSAGADQSALAGQPGARRRSRGCGSGVRHNGPWHHGGARIAELVLGTVRSACSPRQGKSFVSSGRSSSPVRARTNRGRVARRILTTAAPDT